MTRFIPTWRMGAYGDASSSDAHQAEHMFSRTYTNVLKRQFSTTMQRHRHASIVRTVLCSSRACLRRPLVPAGTSTWWVLNACRSSSGAEHRGWRSLRHVRRALLIVLYLYGYQVTAGPGHHVHALGGSAPLGRHAYGGGRLRR